MSGAGSRLDPRERVVGVGLVTLLLLATLGEGGGSAESMLRWHGWLVAVVLWALIMAPFSSRSVPAPPHAPLLPFALFLLLAAAGAARAPYFYAAYLTLVELAAAAAVLFVAARLGRRWLCGLRWPLLAGAAIQGLYAIGQHYLQGEARPPGTFLNTNHFAGWSAVVLLFSLGSLGSPGGGRSRWALAAGAVPVVAGILLSGSRGALIGLAAGGAWLLHRWWPRLGRSRRRAVLALVLVVGSLVAWRLERRLHEPDPFRTQRLRIWRASMSATAEEPWWGTGPGQFAVAADRWQFDDGREPLRFDRRFQISHSDLLRLPGEFGLPAALALLTAAALAIRGIRRRTRRRDDPVRDGAVAALISIGIQALVDNPSRWPALYLLACALIGGLLGRAEEGTVPRRFPFAMRATVGLVMVLAFFVAEVGPTVAHLSFQYLPIGPLTERQSLLLDSVVRLNPIHPDYRARRSEQWTDGDEPLDLKRYAAAREAAEHAVRLSPRDGRYPWALAKVEAHGCLDLFRDEASRRRAVDRYERAHSRMPYEVRVLLDAGEFLLAAGDPAGARRMAERTLRIEPNAVPARVLLAEALIGTGDAGDRRAVVLLDEADRLATAHAGAAGANRYSTDLLSLDRQRVERLRGELVSGPKHGTARMSSAESDKPLGTRIVRGSAWLAALHANRQLLVLVQIVVVARLLTAADLGLLGMALLAVTVLRSLTETGFEQALIHRRDVSVPTLQTAWTVLFARSALLTVLLAASAGLVARFFNEPAAADVLRVLSLTVLIDGCTSIYVVVFQKRLEFRKQFVYTASGQVAELVVTLVAAWYLRSVWALVFGRIAGSVVRVVVSYGIRPHLPRLRFDRTAFSGLVRYGRWLTLSSAITLLLLQGDDLFVGKMLGVVMLGYYQIAYKISNLPATGITHVLSGVLFPAYSSVQGDRIVVGRLYVRSFRLTAMLVVPVAVGIAGLAEPFTRTVLGESWLPIVLLMQVLAVFGLFRSLGATTGAVFLALDRPDLVPKLQAGQLLLLAVVIWPLSSRFGVLGVALAVTLQAVIFNVVALGLALRLCSVRFRRLVGPVAVPAGGAVALYSGLLLAGRMLPGNASVGALIALVGSGAIGYVLFVAVCDRLGGGVYREEIGRFRRAFAGKAPAISEKVEVG